MNQTDNYVKDLNKALMNKALAYLSNFSSTENKLKWLFPNDLIFTFRSWDQIPYDLVSPSKEIQSERIKTLYCLINTKNNMIRLG